ncbi:hypothetical protein [Marinilactibacillus kalidii]|uniref:hypothetical protein n=1 Tax=Marinilactibacillus kalidii TaxID=2820274 RepID=UPI001ABE9D53|nr:hypothetical protein [Marinilactibacillus kalidii]
MKKLFILSTSILLLSSCSNNETTETDETNQIESEQTSEETDSNKDQEGMGTNDTETDEESVENTDDTEDENQNKENTKMTKKEAEEKVIAYINEQADYTETDFYEFNIQDEGSVYTASMYAPVSTDETKGAPIISMYEINQTTGEVKEIEVGNDEQDTAISEIVTMSEEERKAHHRELVAEGESIDKSVLENLMLPGVHMNTTFYEGRVNPGDAIEASLGTADTPPDYEQIDVAPKVDSDGYFTISLSPYDLTNKSVLRFSIQGDYSEEQIFDVSIYEEQAGMENVGVRE